MRSESDSSTDEGRLGTAAAWRKALRYQFSTPATLIALTGSAVAWAQTGRLAPHVLVLIVAALIANQVALHLSDDYFDFLAGVDSPDPARQNLYAGGSKVLPRGELTPRQVLAAFVALYAFTLGVGLYLTWLKGWAVLAIGLFGALCSFFYAAPPVRLSYRGLGELAIGLNFGPTIGIGAYLVQVLPERAKGTSLLQPSLAGIAASIPLEAALATLPLGFVCFAMIVVQEMSDVDEDRRGGKRTLVVRFGKQRAVALHAIGLVATYVVIALMVVAAGATPWLALTLLALPTAARSVSIFSSVWRDAARTDQAVADFVAYRFHSLLGMLLTVAYCLDGLRRGRSGEGAIALIAVLVISYAPVAMILYRQAPGGLPPLRRVLHLLGWVMAAPGRQQPGSAPELQLELDRTAGRG